MTGACSGTAIRGDRRAQARLDGFVAIRSYREQYSPEKWSIQQAFHVSRPACSAGPLDVSPVVVVMGARQTGKSTLVQSEPFSTDRLYLTLDDPDTHERARRTADELVHSAPRLTLDEVQRQPDLLLAVKRAVDADRPRRNGRFILTGSANLLLMRQVSESLAGRATYIHLWPFSRRERLGRGVPGIWSDLLATPVRGWLELVVSQNDTPEDWRVSIRRSGYPTPALELANDDARALWFDGYVRTYLERDLQSLSAVDSLLDFRRLMRAASHRLGGPRQSGGDRPRHRDSARHGAALPQPA